MATGMPRAAALVLALCLLNLAATEASCVVKNTSGQPVVIVPVVSTALEIVVNVGATVVLQPAQQYCYVKNAHTGHKKGPVRLANGGIYAIVDATVVGEVNLCVASLLGGLLNIGISILAGI